VRLATAGVRGGTPGARFVWSARGRPCALFHGLSKSATGPCDDVASTARSGRRYPGLTRERMTGLVDRPLSCTRRLPRTDSKRRVAVSGAVHKLDPAPRDYSGLKVTERTDVSMHDVVSDTRSIPAFPTPLRRVIGHHWPWYRLPGPMAFLGADHAGPTAGQPPSFLPHTRGRQWVIDPRLNPQAMADRRAPRMGP
jgi:hypothetical protein